MRSSIFLSSALAIGVIATPLLDKRYYVTEVDLEIKTVTVYVTPGAPEPTAAAIPSYGQRHRHSHSSKAPAPSSKAAPKPSSVYTPPPAYTPAPTPVQSSQAAPASSAPAAPAGTHQSGNIQATFKSGPDYEAMVVYHHNAARANHNAPELKWDAEAAWAAGEWAKNCTFDHKFPNDNALKHGQNIFLTSGSQPNASAGIIDSWYRGELPAMNGFYGVADINENPVFHEVGHLTQMVWKGTETVGCVSHDCSGGMRNADLSPMSMSGWFLVCNYGPAGNMGGAYAENVLPPKSTSNLPEWND